MFSLNSNSCFTDSFDQNLTVFIENQTELIINTKTGESFATISGYARMSSLSKQAISKRCKNLVNQNQIKTAQVLTTQGLRRVKIISEHVIKEWLYADFPRAAKYLSKHFACGKSLDTLNFDYCRQSVDSKSKLSIEKEIQNKLAKKLQGKTEIVTLAGNIDILTSTELIEVKNVKDWKNAVGQVLIYGHYYPSHQKRIHLFGNYHSSFKSLVEDHCRQLNIIVTWES